MEFILGTAQLATRYGVMATQAPSAARAAELLDAARRLGIRTLDSAPAYEGAESAIGTDGSEFAVHTKLPPDMEPAAALAASLHRLRRDKVEVLHLHDPDTVLDPRSPQLAAAAALVGAGTDAIGASVYSREQFRAAVLDPRISVIQAPMNVLDRAISDEDLDLAARYGTSVIARSALLQGVLGDPTRALGRLPLLDEALAAFARFCERIHRPPVEVAIGWVRSRSHVSSLVLGAETPEQLQGLVRAFRTPPLPEDVLATLANLPLPAAQAVDPRTWLRSEPSGTS